MAKRKAIVKMGAHHTIKLFLVGILSFLLISACGGDVSQKLNSHSSKPLLATSSNGTESSCRAVKHVLGETCVPANPQRIVVVDGMTLDAVLALGVKPIAATDPGLVGSRARYLEGKSKDIASAGQDGQPNLERLVLLNPDLILGFNSALQNYKVFSQIAPTIPSKYVHTAWKDDLRRIGDILNRTQQAERLLAQYQERAEKLRVATGNRLEKTEVSVVRFMAAKGNTHFRTRYSFPGSVLEDVGFPSPAAQRRATESKVPYVSISLERPDLLDGDVIFAALDPGSEGSLNQFETSPLWQTLKAVKNKQVYPVDSGYWTFGNILAANAILDDLFKYLVQGQR